MIVKKNYKVRLLVVLFSFFGLYFIVALRLFFIQIYRCDFFKVLATHQYVTELKSEAPRALIYDRQNVAVALNREIFSAFILPNKFKEEEKTKKIVKKYFRDAYKKISKKTSKGFYKNKFLWLERHLSDKRLQQIKNFNSKDIYFLAEPKRFYPFFCAAHVVGFTNVDNVGIGGIELQFNKLVCGKPTTFILQKDARFGNFYFNKNIEKEGSIGDSVTLTIDRNLQFFAHEELEKTVARYEAKGGAVLIMDPDSGHVLAMVSNPGFDSNQMRDINLEHTKNIIVTECFEMGSVIKVFAALAALEEGVVTIDEEIDCEGKSTYIDRFRVENWKSLGPGLHPFSQVVARSNNVGIAKIAKRLGPRLYHHLRRVGFGDSTGICFPGERSGFVNSPDNWSRSSIIVLSFGYEIMSTILQLGKAFSIIANGGYNIQPVLVMNPKREKLLMQYNRLYSSESIDQIKKILELSGWMKDRYSIEGFRIIGKTGTARTVKNGKYSRKDHVYTYAGIVENGDYKRVIITFIKEPKREHIWATQLTVPLFYEVAKKMIVYDLTTEVLKS